MWTNVGSFGSARKRRAGLGSLQKFYAESGLKAILDGFGQLNLQICRLGRFLR
jgi:hypothetical protein